MERTSSSGNSQKTNMSRDEFSGLWKQFRGSARQWWGKLTDDDLERVAGQKDKLTGILQEKYGYTRDRAEREVTQHLDELRAEMSSTPGRLGQQSTSATAEMAQQAKNAVGAVGERVRDLGTNVNTGAEQVRTSVAEGMESVAETIQHRAPEEGPLASAATSTADNVESAANYVRDNDFAKMSQDLAAIVRRYPLPALLVGVGLGYLMASRGR